MDFCGALFPYRYEAVSKQQHAAYFTGIYTKPYDEPGFVLRRWKNNHPAWALHTCKASNNLEIPSPDAKSGLLKYHRVKQPITPGTRKHME